MVKTLLVAIFGIAHEGVRALGGQQIAFLGQGVPSIRPASTTGASRQSRSVSLRGFEIAEKPRQPGSRRDAGGAVFEPRRLRAFSQLWAV